MKEVTIKKKEIKEREKQTKNERKLERKNLK